MGMADIAEVLWNDFLRHNPGNPDWTDRDRFVLSNGHGSMLQYALLHLSGYELPIEEIKNFRQLFAKTPGHPEYGLAPGVETTTGPLGQGLANAVGMAIAERVLAQRFNRPEHTIVDHHTYVFVGDGCLMEGISHEACSLAGTLGLGKLVAVYDDNGISIDGPVQGWFTDDTVARFRAYGWHVVPEVDGHDPQAIATAIDEARSVGDRPSLVCCRTVIGWGSPNKQGKESSHGAALGEDEVARVRETIGWSHAPFEVPHEVYAGWDARQLGAQREADWSERFAAYAEAHPQLAAEFERCTQSILPSRWEAHSQDFVHQQATRGESMATRKASLECLEAFGPMLPELIGGSADLTGSNLTLWSDSKALSCDDDQANYIYYGVREFGMCAINNGIALHGGLTPYGGTFLTFSDYARNALRMAALMRIRTILVFTHDSIGLGEDGPTHQAVEHAASLRLIPNMCTWRPCDTVETAAAWKHAIERLDGPTSLLLSRQTLPHQDRTVAQVDAIARGGYVLLDTEETPRAIVIATGSEVGLAVAAAHRLNKKGHAVRVVSMPSTDVFDAQSAEYRDHVLPRSVTARVAVEAGVPDLWPKYVGLAGRVVGLNRYGESAPAKDVFAHFGFTVEHVCEALEEVIAEAATGNEVPQAVS
jgi:transketolase